MAASSVNATENESGTSISTSVCVRVRPRTKQEEYARSCIALEGSGTVVFSQGSEHAGTVFQFERAYGTVAQLRAATAHLNFLAQLTLGCAQARVPARQMSSKKCWGP